MTDQTPLTIIYTNWRGETRLRQVIPVRVWFGETQWHPEPQWLLAAIDTETGETRNFAFAGIGGSTKVAAQADHDASEHTTVDSVARGMWLEDSRRWVENARLHGRSKGPVEIDPDEYDFNSTMPISGPEFRRRWEGLARVALKIANQTQYAGIKDRASEEEAFDRADWFWRAMDPDESGDSPHEAIHASGLGDYCVCEISSSYHGPTRFAFIAPTLAPDDDDTEVLHFPTQEEAIASAAERKRLIAEMEASNDEA